MPASAYRSRPSLPSPAATPAGPASPTPRAGRHRLHRTFIETLRQPSGSVPTVRTADLHSGARRRDRDGHAGTGTDRGCHGGHHRARAGLPLLCRRTADPRRARPRLPAARRTSRLGRAAGGAAGARPPGADVSAGAPRWGVVQLGAVAPQEARAVARDPRRDGGGVMGLTLLSTGSLLAAFFAGGVALFAPCCIVFLAPSYLAVAVKNRRWRLLPLTFVFAAGLALVLVPITVGMSLVAATISHYHAPLYYAGGTLMLALAAWSLSGRMWSLPSVLRAPDTANRRPGQRRERHHAGEHRSAAGRGDPGEHAKGEEARRVPAGGVRGAQDAGQAPHPVSYTHLTLPTKRIV